MKDKLTKCERSQLMAKVRGHGNESTELALAKLFRRNKITGWRRQVELRIANEELRIRASGGNGKIRNSKFRIRHFKVRPDFVFPKLKLAVFVDGCFWHGCPKHGTQPKGNHTFWKKKFARNMARDRLVNQALRTNGWQVLRIWEHDLARKREARLLRRIQRALE